MRPRLLAELADPDRAIFVWEAGGELAGFCSAAVAEEPGIAETGARAHIEDLYVREAARGGGVGRALAEAVLGWARERGAASVEVRVAAANREGRDFWRALSFGDWMDVLERPL